MAKVEQGSVTVVIPDHIEILPEAGTLTSTQLARHSDKARRGVGLACKMTADSMRKNEKLTITELTADEVERLGTQADDIDKVILDIELLLMKLKQNNFLLDAKAHRALRRVRSHVKSLEPFDPRIVDTVPELIQYFSVSKKDEEEQP